MTYKLALVQTADTVSNNTMLPLAVGVLYSYAMQHDHTLTTKFELLDVVYRKENIAEQAKYLSQADVACFSCYLWNLKYQLTLMKAIKEINPNVYIVVGGPAIVSNDPGFWLLNKRWVDLAIEGEGEDSITKLLQQFPNINPREIPGAFGASWNNGLPERCKVFPKNESPYLNGFYDKILDEIVNRGELPQAVIQTNRGCPYHCGFCEEGADYKNKLFEYDYDRVIEELSWCSKHGVYNIVLADDNFGILKRDIDILQHLIDLKLAHGYPSIVGVTFAKNAPDRVALMSEMMISSKVNFIQSTTIALQSLNEETLVAIKRFNLDEDKHKKLINRLNELGMATYVELIWPLPYETYQTFCNGIDKLAARDLLNWINVYSFAITPGIDISKEFPNDLKAAEGRLQSATKFDGTIEEQAQLVYETTWASHDEVVRGHVFTMWLSSLYFFGYGRYLIDQLIKEKNTTVSTIINNLIDYAKENDGLLGQWTEKLTNHWFNRLINNPITDLSIFPGEDTTHWYHFTHLSSWINQNRDQFYRELKDFAITQGLSNVDFVFEILPDHVIQPDKKYPYVREVNGCKITVDANPQLLSFKEQKFNNDYEFSRFYYFWKRQSGWHRTIVSVQS